MKDQVIRVTDLQLDTGNYRTGKQEDQREAIRALIEEQKIKLVHLAEDIIQNGLSPLETILVMPMTDDKNRFVVIEGNRRVAAMKLVTQPDLASETTWHNAFKRLHKLLPGQLPTEVRCIVAPNKEDAFIWIQRRHDTGLKGAGLESWSTIAQYRAHAARGKSAPEFDVLEFALAQGRLEPDVQERVIGQDFPITNLKRLVNSGYVSEQLELDRGETTLSTTASKKWVLSVFREMVTAIAREEFNGDKFSVKDIYTAADQKRFFNKIVSKHPKPAKSVRRWAVNAETNVKDAERGLLKKRKPNRPTSERRKLIPSGCTVRPPLGRANDIFLELRRLEVETFRNSVSILLRVFLEFSIEAYIDRRAVTGVNSGDKLSKKLLTAADHMESNGIMDKKELHAVRKAGSDANSLFSTVTLNAYVHNVNFYPSASELKTSWDNLEPFIEKLWHA
ncbi:MAG TPA: ParB/Srx family N-terminal domain-containing protein [Candidatus Angelobacter sp.]|nr:ParB/Srx family N-terminal domain-containing protein [Candidatus Angelobacter sp.]